MTYFSGYFSHHQMIHILLTGVLLVHLTTMRLRLIIFLYTDVYETKIKSMCLEQRKLLRHFPKEEASNHGRALPKMLPIMPYYFGDGTLRIQGHSQPFTLMKIEPQKT